MNKPLGSNEQYGDDSEIYCIIYLKLSQRVGLKCSHHIYMQKKP